MMFAFKPCPLEVTVMVDLSDSEWNLTLQPLKTFLEITMPSYVHQIWQDSDLTRGAPTINSHDSLITWS